MRIPRMLDARSTCIVGLSVIVATGCFTSKTPLVDKSDASESGGEKSTGSGGQSGSGGATKDDAAGQGGSKGGTGGLFGSGGAPVDSGADAGTPCTKPSDCASGVCLFAGAAGTCQPAVNVTGFVQHADTVSTTGQAGVTLSVTNAPASLTTQSHDFGAFTLPGAPPGTVLDMEMAWPSCQSAGAGENCQTAPFKLPTAMTQTRFFVQSREASGNQTVDPPVIPFSWISQVAVDCGIFKTLAEAQGAGSANPFWISRSTLLVEVLDSNPAGIGYGDISVVLGGRVNTDDGEGDAGTGHTKLCFLDKQGASYVGTKLTSTTAAGRFVMFRLSNAQYGTGDGLAEVHVKNYPIVSVSFKSSGQFGFARVGATFGITPQQGPIARDFERDIYPIFTADGCYGCHSPGNPGYDSSVPRGPAKLKADYSGTPDQVYAVLLATNAGEDGGVCSATTTTERVCVANPAGSLLAHKPLTEPPPEEQDHQWAYFPDTNDPDYRAIVDWIAQGAKRH